MKTLKNGLKVLFKHKSGASATIQLTVNVGSINEKEGQKGYSHLIEHLLFEGTKKRPSNKEITSIIENLGGEFNAATSNESTHYYIKILSKHYKRALDVLSDIVLNSTFDHFEKERSVVLEEIKMLNDNPRYSQWFLFENKLFTGTNYEHPVYGYVKDLNLATKESLLDYFRNYYTPDNAILAIVGDFEEPLILSEINSAFSSWEGSVEKKEFKLPFNEERSFDIEKDVQQVYLVLGKVAPSLLDNDSPVYDVIESILGKPLSGLLVDEIRNKRGLAYDVSVSYENFRNFGFFAINVVMDLANKNVVESLIYDVLGKLQNVSEDEIDAAKSHIEGRIILDLEDSHKSAELLTFWHQISGKDYQEEYFEKIKNVKKEDVIRVASELKEFTKVALIPNKS